MSQGGNHSVRPSHAFAVSFVVLSSNFEVDAYRPTRTFTRIVKPPRLCS